MPILFHLNKVLKLGALKFLCPSVNKKEKYGASVGGFGFVPMTVSPGSQADISIFSLSTSSQVSSWQWSNVVNRVGDPIWVKRNPVKKNHNQPTNQPTNQLKPTDIR